MKNFVLTDSRRLSDDKIAPYAQGVKTSLEGNVYFNLPPELVTHFSNSITDYILKLSKSKIGTSMDVAAKNIAKEVLEDDLQKVAKAVNTQADGDIEKLKSSGLTLAKERAKKGILAKPTNFKVSSGTNSGDFSCTVDACPDIKVYNFYSSAVPTPANLTEWRLTPSTTRKKNITGYTPGKQYEFKCAYLGTDETLVFSDSIVIFAQ